MTGKADGSTVQAFDLVGYIESQASAAKKAAVKEISTLTGFDVEKGVFDGDVGIGKAIELFKSIAPSRLEPDLLDRVLIDKATTVHLTVDFAAETATIHATTIHIAAIVGSGNGFSCGDIVLKEVRIFVANMADTVTVFIGKTQLLDARFKEWKLGYPTVRELTCAEVTLPRSTSTRRRSIQRTDGSSTWSSAGRTFVGW